GRRLRWQLRIGLVDPFAEIRDPPGDAAHGVHVSSLPHASATQELPGPAMLTEREHDARHISPGHECASPCPRSPPPSWARGYLTGPTSPGDGPHTGRLQRPKQAPRENHSRTFIASSKARHPPWTPVSSSSTNQRSAG